MQTVTRKKDVATFFPFPLLEPPLPPAVFPPVSNNLSMPPLAFGTGSSFTLLSPSATKSAILSALAAGHRHFDLAEMYGNHAAIGAAFTAAFETMPLAREDLFITTKVWTTNMNHVAEAVDQMLLDLNVAYIDLLLIHWPVPMVFTGDIKSPSKGASTPVDEHGNCGYSASHDVLETWRQFEAAVDSGKTNLIGCSNCNQSILHALTTNGRLPVAVNQVEGHPGLTQKSLLSFAAQRGVYSVFYSPFGGPEGELLRNPAVGEAALKRSCTPGQLLLAWGLQRGAGGSGAVASSKSPRRMVENLNAEGACGKAAEKDLDLDEINEERFYSPDCFDFLFA